MILMAQAATFTNPVLNHDFPDPDVLQVGDSYYAYATNTGQINIQTARSSDLVTWELLGDALPTLPAWAMQNFGFAWAPDVSQRADGTFLMYVTARFPGGNPGGTQCIGAATADDPAGPFTPVGDAPLVCPLDEGGAIDPATFVDDDGTHYLLWKNDGNSRGAKTWIYIQPISEDGLILQGEPTRLIVNDQPWEGRVIEAPTLWKQDGRYYLFYSANAYDQPRYAIGYAVADSPLGPYQKAEKPLLASIMRPGGIVGPGGQDVIVVNGQTWLFFHKWSVDNGRDMNLVRLQWQDGAPFVEWSRDPQSVP
jgi:beta-xylosidase